MNLLRHIRSKPCAAIEGNKAYLATVPATAVDHWAAELESLPLALFGSGMHELEWHAAQGHRIFVVRGTLAPLARVAARRFSVSVEICATELETMSARWTGRIQGEHISGPAKARAVARLAARYDLDLKLSFAYGDQPSDLAMLETVGKFNDELIRAGVLLAAEGLADATEGVVVDFSSEPPMVTDGPYGETKGQRLIESRAPGR